MNHAHEGHGGMSLCKRLMKNICWFPKLETFVNNTIKDCAPCQYNEDSTTNEPIKNSRTLNGLPSVEIRKTQR